MSSAVDLAGLVATLPTRAIHTTLARCVPQLDFLGGRPPRYLFLSGRRNRCNSEGVS